ncbi:hypothetical protein DF047_35655 [Burkholderia cenocepacia]|uniref:hypothetical protein n=1 Tax=Burkholderia TaxID=32008 RepID=UPI00075BE540|nr:MULTISPECIES: hypothetical protein [Burkholderia]KVP19736.1 hypothetical protein WJ84_11700 [Burkholderia ubonensis]MDR8093033.1 hypothetical protein [Burkholderia gladioli]RQU99193.1 hypothetical protein DF047_35655 [Burkholderia cenocepacia]
MDSAAPFTAYLATLFFKRLAGSDTVPSTWIVPHDDTYSEYVLWHGRSHYRRPVGRVVWC